MRVIVHERDGGRKRESKLLEREREREKDNVPYASVVSPCTFLTFFVDYAEIYKV